MKPVTLALAGDTMLGRLVGARLEDDPKAALFAPDLVEIVHSADGMLLNLECCISERGEQWPGRVFHFRAPPAAADVLTGLGVSCVTLANNHALDFGYDALLDTLDYLAQAGIAAVGAGVDMPSARRPATFAVGDESLTVLSFSDHPPEYAATADVPGIAHADIHSALPAWITSSLASLPVGPPLIVSPHWGPNMTPGPADYIERAADQLVAGGAALVAGHSAHVFHGAHPPVLYDLGDFVDDYATHPALRNDLGLLWLVTFDGPRVCEVEVVPLHLAFCFTELARGDDARFVRDRLRDACRAFDAEIIDTARGLAITG
jgi:poly-gamma-glutamate capsule biosynthesis protein CapA/YwtB (metallophosphatase superfamily)